MEVTPFIPLILMGEIEGQNAYLSTRYSLDTALWIGAEKRDYHVPIASGFRMTMEAKDSE
jgi:hypothetical protein